MNLSDLGIVHPANVKQNPLDFAYIHRVFIISTLVTIDFFKLSIFMSEKNLCNLKEIFIFKKTLYKHIK